MTENLYFHPLQPNEEEPESDFELIGRDEGFTVWSDFAEDDSEPSERENFDLSEPGDF